MKEYKVNALVFLISGIVLLVIDFIFIRGIKNTLNLICAICYIIVGIVYLVLFIKEYKKDKYYKKIIKEDKDNE